MIIQDLGMEEVPNLINNPYKYHQIIRMKKLKINHQKIHKVINNQKFRL